MRGSVYVRFYLRARLKISPVFCQIRLKRRPMFRYLDGPDMPVAELGSRRTL